MNRRDLGDNWVTLTSRFLSGLFILAETRDSGRLRSDVSKYRPEAYESEKLKNPKKIHRVALVKLLSEIYFLFRFDDYY